MAQLRLIIGAFQDGPMDLDSSKVGGDEPWISYQETSPIVVRLEATGSEKKSPSVHLASRTRPLDRE